MKKKLLPLLLLCSCLSPLICSAGSEREVTLKGLGQAAGWIKKNMSFPMEAYRYGFVGVERFVISADWEGRVFITSHLSALNPALEQEIKDVVGRCPKCIVSGALLKDVYQSVEIDFADFVRVSTGRTLADVGFYAAPYFVPSGDRRDSMADSRDVFWKAVSGRFRLPKGVNLEFPMFISVDYTVSEDGLVCDIVSDGCDREIFRALEKAMKRTRGWTPAMTRTKSRIPVFVHDSLSVGVGDDGVVELLRCRDDVMLNARTAPEDGDVIVMVPDVPACMTGGYASVSKMLNDSLDVDATVRFAGSFVVEKDGSVSNIYVNTSSPVTDSSLVALVSRTRWTPAMSGGKPVRSVHRFIGTADGYEYVRGVGAYNPYPSFMSDGKRHNLAYDGRRKRAYMDIVNEYPSFGADVYGYGKYRYFNHSTYVEALMIKGKTPFGTVMIKKRRNKK
ncbi:MAG: hypothetical protein J6B62_09485 [Bacteroidales bacterium]|nr:hypothetical protein [Bacteroidales bacterium]